MANVKNIERVLHKKSSQLEGGKPKLPSASVLDYGEIAVNYADSKETLSVKSSGNKIATFSSDNIIVPQIEKLKRDLKTLSDTVVMGVTSTSVRAYSGDSAPTLSTYSGDRDKLVKVLKHFKLGWFDGEGKLVRECARGRISLDINGNDIPIDGSLKDASGNTCDLMAYVDTDLYVDRCTLSGVSVEGIAHDPKNFIGLGLEPHEIEGKEAKKFEPFGFTPHCANYHTTNGKVVGYSYCDGTHVNVGYNSLTSSTYGRNKGGGYMGLYYEFYEVWLIAMYLELGTLNFIQSDMFGWGNTSHRTPNQSNWCKDGSVGGRGFLQPNDTFINHNGLIGWGWFNFAYLLEPLKMMDAIVRGGFANEIGGERLYYLDEDGNAQKAPNTVDVNHYSGITEGDANRYFTVSNVKNSQGLADGVMTAVVNIYYKGTHTPVTSGHSESFIAKESHPIYRGLDLLSGFFTHLEGFHYVIKASEDDVTNKRMPSQKELFYATHWSQLPSEASAFTGSNSIVRGDISDAQVPFLVKDYARSGKNDVAANDWVKVCDYNKSLFAVDAFGGGGASYNECGFQWGTRTSYGSTLGVDNNDGRLTAVGQSMNAAAVGCPANYSFVGRTLICHISVSYAHSYYAGGFAHPYIKV